MAPSQGDTAVLYLHGFASSPWSSKAQYFSARFARRGIAFYCPDLNQPDFPTLTVSRMLQQTEAAINRLPAAHIVLMGSSLGGFVAVEAAARQTSGTEHPITHLILLAPAVELEWDRWSEVGPHGVDRWREAGDLEVFHYAQDAPARLNFGFYEDAERYHPARRRLDLPMLIFQGREDESVSPSIVERFAAAHPNATLHLLDDTHQLKKHLDFMWVETVRFLGL
jgi:pimeloyl-ACP methyl ester carboxylesterase